MFLWLQALLRECRGLHGDLEAMGEREGQLGEVLQTERWIQQVKNLSRRTEELQQTAKTRLQSLQDAAKVNDNVANSFSLIQTFWCTTRGAQGNIPLE